MDDFVEFRRSAEEEKKRTNEESKTRRPEERDEKTERELRVDISI